MKSDFFKADTEKMTIVETEWEQKVLFTIAVLSFIVGVLLYFVPLFFESPSPVFFCIGYISLIVSTVSFLMFGMTLSGQEDEEPIEIEDRLEL